VVTHQLQVERRTAKERWPETDVLPLSHAGKPIIYCTADVVLCAINAAIYFIAAHILFYFIAHVTGPLDIRAVL